MEYKSIHRFALQRWQWESTLFVCLWKQCSGVENKRNQASYLLPKPTVHEAMWIGNSSSESQRVNAGPGKSWVIMKISKSNEENIIWSQSSYCSFMVCVCGDPSQMKYRKCWGSVSKQKKLPYIIASNSNYFGNLLSERLQKHRRNYTIRSQSFQSNVCHSP